MKNILKVTILFCIIIACFVIPSFATSTNGVDFSSQPIPVHTGNATNQDFLYQIGTNNLNFYCSCTEGNAFVFYCTSDSRVYWLGDIKDSIVYWSGYSGNSRVETGTKPLSYIYLSDEGFYNYAYTTVFNPSTQIPIYSNRNDGFDDIINLINQPSYTKNPNVDEFIANTMISMGVKFDTPAYALSYASNAWDWCIDETNLETANPFDEWNIDAFVSYCNAQSNNYLNWYNGYKVSEDVTNALGEYIRQNIRSLTGLPAGVTSLTGAYMPIYHYGSGFQSGSSSPTAQTFYPAQTITYFNGEYVNETNDISTSQFLYTPADVRRFLGYPGSSPVITPSSPTGTGTITDDHNNPDQKNITINFPSLDWLANAIKSILDFLRDAFTTLANLLTQLLDAILGLFSDAFAGLADFGQGIIGFLQSVFAGLSTLLNGYVPSDLAVIIACFIALNFGVGLITFVLKGH